MTSTPAPIRSRRSRHALALAAVLILSGCAGVAPTTDPAPDSLADEAAASAARGDHSQAATLYRQAAERASEPERSHYFLRAGTAAARAGDGDLAGRMLDLVERKALSIDDRTALELARLRARAAGLPPEEALQRIGPPGPAATPALAAGTWKLRAELLFEAGRAVDGVHALVQRDVWLLNPEAVRRNDFRIWEALRESPQAVDPRTVPSEVDETTRGWLRLARIDRQSWPGRDDLENALATWEQRYPGHPATRNVLPEVFDYKPAIPSTAERGDADVVGLALPLTGDFAEAAATLRDGFLAAYYEQPPPRPDLRIYDTTRFPGTQALLQHARADGVGVLVGPLAKQAVASLGIDGSPPMPVLALNYTDTGDSFPGFYQFGLAPEDEARSAARRAMAKGWSRALALVPEGDWGGRVLDAFRDAMTRVGGELLDYARFDPSEQDHAAPIKRVLRYRGVDEDAVRAEGMDDIERGRRQDADFIFLAAQPDQARLLRTQLRFYRATRLPVLATSHVYTGEESPDRDSDLNGLMFADMPWILGTGDADARRPRLADHWSEAAESNPRLFAMGLDAWELATRLHGRDLRPGSLFAGAAGRLYLEPDGQVRRRLDWARFVRGRPEALPPRDTIVLPGRGDRAQPIPAGSPAPREDRPSTDDADGSGF